MMLQDKEKQPSKSSAFGWLLKILLFLSIFLFIIFSVMTMLGGNGDALKKGAEDFLQVTFGGPAQITQFNGLTFFPNMGFDAEGIVVQKSAEDETPVLTIQKAHVSIGFFDAMFQTGKLKTLNIQKLDAKSGTVFDKRLIIERLAILSQEDDTYRLKGNGQIGGKSFSLEMPMELSGAGYKFPKERDVKASLGSVSMQGVWRDGFTNELKDFVIRNDEGHEVKTNLVFSGLLALNINGELLLQDQLVINPALSIKEKGNGASSVKGAVVIPRINKNQFSLIGQSIEMIEDISSSFSGKKNNSDRIDLGDGEIDIKLEISEILSEEKRLGDVAVNISIKDRQLEIKPQGRVIGGALGGGIRLNTQADTDSLDVDLSLKNAYLSELMSASEKRSGLLNISLNLSGEGAGQSALKSDLDGALNIVGGKGEFNASLINLWGGGVVNALIPSFDKKKSSELNCAIIHADIENGMASLKPFFVDTSRVTLKGTGMYNIVENNLDVKIKPEPKDVSLGDISAGVVLSGAIQSPNASVSKLDLGKKIGGLLLGAVNPAFYVATLADMGLGDDHPCHAFVPEESN